MMRLLRPWVALATVIITQTGSQRSPQPLGWLEEISVRMAARR